MTTTKIESSAVTILTPATLGLLNAPIAPNAFIYSNNFSLTADNARDFLGTLAMRFVYTNTAVAGDNLAIWFRAQINGLFESLSDNGRAPDLTFLTFPGEGGNSVQQQNAVDVPLGPFTYTLVVKNNSAQSVTIAPSLVTYSRETYQ